MQLPVKNRAIGIELIVSKNISNKAATTSLEESILRLKRIWLDKEEITKIDNLELLGNVTHVHLDFNQISVIENLETLGSSLQHLSLKGNKIESIGTGLQCLTKLISLDLGGNCIKSVSPSEIPSSVMFLNLLDNPVIASDDFDEESFLKEFPGMKVFNNKIIKSLEDSDSDNDDDDEVEDENEIDCLQDITCKLKKSSKDRQTLIEMDHQNKVSTLALLKTEMESNKNKATTSSEDPFPALSSESSNNIGRNCLPSLERPLSSQSISKRSGQLEPLNHKPSSPLSRLTTPPSKPKPPAPLLAPKRSEKSAKLRQPLEMELVKADDFDDYLNDVNKKFNELRNQFQGL